MVSNESFSNPSKRKSARGVPSMGGVEIWRDIDHLQESNVSVAKNKDEEGIETIIKASLATGVKWVYMIDQKESEP